MRLLAYLQQKKLSYAAFGRLCQPEIKRVTVRQYALGLRRPRDISVIAAIARATENEVTANDLFADQPDQQEAA